ncbi:MAG: hypothetical protein KAW19_03030 [Candidatus Aminicenantes bacterium]|nr:hypothetical protein [Candidatus Aminicenantes bacterium]
MYEFLSEIFSPKIEGGFSAEVRTWVRYAWKLIAESAGLPMTNIQKKPKKVPVIGRNFPVIP